MSAHVPAQEAQVPAQAGQVPAQDAHVLVQEEKAVEKAEEKAEEKEKVLIPKKRRQKILCYPPRLFLPCGCPNGKFGRHFEGSEKHPENVAIKGLLHGYCMQCDYITIVFNGAQICEESRKLDTWYNEYSNYVKCDMCHEKIKGSNFRTGNSSLFDLSKKELKKKLATYDKCNNGLVPVPKKELYKGQDKSVFIKVKGPEKDSDDDNTSSESDSDYTSSDSEPDSDEAE